MAVRIRAFCAYAPYQAGAASPVRSPRAVDVVHRPEAAGAYRSRSGIGSASVAFQAGAWKGSAKHRVSFVTRSSANSLTLTG